MAEWLEINSKAPDFTLVNDQNEKLKLSELIGKPLVLYFYPKDDTPGCTTEACEFRDSKRELEKLGASVLGISGDSAQSHADFRNKYSLNFPLLADEDFKVSKKYSTYREKNMYGKKSMGIQRSTYIIDTVGNIAKVFKRVSVDGHCEEVLAAIKSLTA